MRFRRLRRPHVVVSAADRTATGALVLGTGLLVALATSGLGAAETASAGDVCVHPEETEAQQGWTVRVRCNARFASAHPVRGPARLLFGERLDLNRANAAALQVLPGIGPARAAAIVATRSETPFADAEDLVRVPGIGPRTQAALAPYIEVGERDRRLRRRSGRLPATGSGGAE